jgi:thiamine-monophosphate kinase
MKMKLTDLGEKEIIRRLGRFLDIGDDAAYIKIGAKYLILTTDMINAETHVPRSMTPEQIGKFIVTVNLSDIAAMGAEPVAFLLAYGGPDGDFEDFQRLIKGVDKQCRRYGTRYAGGDTKYARELTLSGTAVGLAKKPVLRSGAKVGDLVAVTGTVGNRAMAIDLILRGLQCDKKLIKKALEPEPRVEEGILLGRYASAMTDISDSLSLSIYDIASQSDVGVRLDVKKIPLEKGALKLAEGRDLNMMDYALYGGGDYELLFTASEDNLETIEKEIDATIIGRITKKRDIVGIDSRGDFPLKRMGYEHFKRISG